MAVTGPVTVNFPQTILYRFLCRVSRTFFLDGYGSAECLHKHKDKKLKTKKKGFSCTLAPSTLELLRTQAVSDKVSQSSIVESAIISYCESNSDTITSTISDNGTMNSDSETITNDSESTITSTMEQQIQFHQQEIQFKNREIEEKNKQIENLHQIISQNNHLMLLQKQDSPQVIEHQNNDEPVKVSSVGTDDTESVKPKKKNKKSKKPKKKKK